MMVERDIRITYTKEGVLRYIGHLDTTRVLTRALARSSMPVLYSQGFSPHMKVSFGPPLPLGYTSEMELAEVSMDDADAAAGTEEWRGELQSFVPAGMRIVSLKYVEDGVPPVSKAIDRAEYEIMLPGQFSLSSDDLARFLREEEISVEKLTKSGRKTVNIRPAVESFNVVDRDSMGDRMSVYRLTTVIGGSVSASPAQVLEVLLGKAVGDDPRREDPSYEAVFIRRAVIGTTNRGSKMYLSFYGLSEKPFNLTPDANFLYPSEIHREVLGHLLYGINNRMGFICVTGEVGAGKTTLCRVLLNQLDEKTEVAFVLNSYLTEFELLKTINEDLGLSTTGRTRKELIDELNKFLVEKRENGGNVAVIIDEAQNLSIPVLEQLRMLSNIETEKEKLLQIILVGQPELNDVLLNEKIRQLNQRITVRHHITPLSKAEVKEYIYYRLKVAGSRGDIVFTDGAVDEIYRYSRGIPRAINVIGEQSLLVGYVANSRRITRKMVRKAVKEVWGEKKDEIAGRKGYRVRGILSRAGAGIGVVALLTVGSFYFLQSIKGSNPGDRIVASDTTGRGTGENDPYAVEKQGVQEAPSDTDIMTVEGTQTIQTDDASSDTDPADDGGQTSLIMTAMTSGAGTMLGKTVDEVEDPVKQLGTESPYVESDFLNPLETGIWARELDATVDLMRLWKVPESYVHAIEVQYSNVEIDPAGVARIADMGFVKLGSDIATLSDANLPAVMEMKNKDGSMGYGVLKSVSGDKAEVVVKSRTFKIGMEELGGMATGNAVIYCSDRLVDPTVMRDGDIMSTAARKLQDYLKELGYFEGNADGWFREDTKAAVEEFQSEHGLEATGEATGYVKLLIYKEISKGKDDIPWLR